jgi:competence protein ComFC
MLTCFSCGELSFPIICEKCAKNLLTPSLIKRELGELQIFSFYKYSEIEKFLLTKHNMVGAKIFEILARESFGAFAKNFEYDEKLTVLPIDDHTDNGYSHTAILANALKSDILKPKYGSLHAKNKIKYAGQTLEFRQNNPRGFEYSGKKISVVLVDDIITTGTTLLEAKDAVERAGGEVLFALTLADARE